MVFNYGWAPQRFGAKRGKKRRHAGIDLGTAGKKGVPVGCPVSGFKVASVKRRGGYGNTVDLVSLDGTKMMRFAHLANPLPKHLKVGVVVNQGDWLGDVGNTGGRYAIHLHFEYRIKQGNSFVPVNPFNNKYHTFCRQDFEASTKMAYASRKAVRSGKGLASATIPTVAETVSEQPMKPTKTPVAVQKPKKGKIAQPAVAQNNQQLPPVQSQDEPVTPPQRVWTLDRGFNQPSWWERNMPEILGGWSKKELQEAEERRKLDEEVFEGVRRVDLLNIGLNNDDISKLQAHVNAKIASGDVRSTLNKKSVAVNFNDLYDDKDKAKSATQFFMQKGGGTNNNRMA